ncbi:MAG: VPLPA-CTERM sorting domain-containing protein [Thermodesulfobacteriota bacterium]
MKKQAAAMLLAIFLCGFATHAGAMTIPEARVYGQADDGWNTFDHTELYSNTSSLSHEFRGVNTGYANHAFGGDNPSLGASAYAITDGTTTNFGAITVPYLYFQWRVAPNEGVANVPSQIAVMLEIQYTLSRSITWPGFTGNDAYFNDSAFGYLWFAPVATPSYPYTPGDYVFHDDAYINNWNTTYMQLSAHAQTGNVGGMAEVESTFTGFLSLPEAYASDYHIEYKTVEAPVPVPAAVWLLGSGLLGLAGLRRKHGLKR